MVREKSVGSFSRRGYVLAAASMCAGCLDGSRSNSQSAIPVGKRVTHGGIEMAVQGHIATTSYISSRDNSIHTSSEGEVFLLIKFAARNISGRNKRLPSNRIGVSSGGIGGSEPYSHRDIRVDTNIENYKGASTITSILPERHIFVNGRQYANYHRSLMDTAVDGRSTAVSPGREVSGLLKFGIREDFTPDDTRVSVSSVNETFSWNIKE